MADTGPTTGLSMLTVNIVAALRSSATVYFHSLKLVPILFPGQ